jgi:D-inositol-3-phosphate glycosyltransferase
MPLKRCSAQGDSLDPLVPRSLTLFAPGLSVSLNRNMFGKDVANFELFRAIARHGGLDEVCFLATKKADPAQLASQLFPAQGPRPTVSTGLLTDHVAPLRTGAMLRGSAQIEELAWARHRVMGAGRYSLIGLIHTIAPPSIRDYMAASLVAPTYEWDALICTSPSVQAAMRAMFDEHGAYLAARTGGKPPPGPQLALLPLGVDGERFAAHADRPGARASFRAELGAGDDDFVMLWVGRLSYFEKTFPQPMMLAAELAAKASGKRVHFVMAGWFPHPESERPLYLEAARAHCPSVNFVIVDGNNAAKLADAWAGADTFISLVDNIQETFGITPLEAMAAGLPVVASDWDGYRYTVRDGIEGFLIPTLGGPPGGLPFDLVEAHARGERTYQQYVAILAQHTAIDVKRAGDALTALAASPDLRGRMGAAGRRRIAETFDWRVVAPAYVALAEELAARRPAAGDPRNAPGRHPPRGEPFGDFAGFATTILTDDLVLSLAPGETAGSLAAMPEVWLDTFAANWRLPREEAAAAFAQIADGPIRFGALAEGFPAGRRRLLGLSVLWMCKRGLVVWSR